MGYLSKQVPNQKLFYLASEISRLPYFTELRMCLIKASNVWNYSVDYHFHILRASPNCLAERDHSIFLLRVWLFLCQLMMSIKWPNSPSDFLRVEMSPSPLKRRSKLLVLGLFSLSCLSSLRIYEAFSPTSLFFIPFSSVAY